MADKGRYIKAMVLLAVFSMNTVMSFACSLSSFIHSVHHSVASTEEAGLHHHAHESGGHHHGDEPAPEKNNDCCSADMVQMEMADKSPGRSIQLPLPQLQNSYILQDSHTNDKPLTMAGDLFADAWRWRPPVTIQDLRIVIQSFQI